MSFIIMREATIIVVSSANDVEKEIRKIVLEKEKKNFLAKFAISYFTLVHVSMHTSNQVYYRYSLKLEFCFLAGVRGGTPYCQAVKRCKECNFRLRTSRTGRPHKCYHTYCNQCQTDVPAGHKTCFISPIPPISPSFVKKTIIFDIEVNIKHLSLFPHICRFQTTIEIVNGKKQHKPNLIMALRSCEECETALPASPSDTELSCAKCGGQKLHVWSSFDDPSREMLEEFVNWAFSHRNFTVIAHNLRGWAKYEVFIFNTFLIQIRRTVHSLASMQDCATRRRGLRVSRKETNVSKGE